MECRVSITSNCAGALTGYLVCYACGLSRLAGGYSIPNSTSNSAEFLDLETSSQARTNLCWGNLPHDPQPRRTQVTPMSRNHCARPAMRNVSQNGAIL